MSAELHQSPKAPSAERCPAPDKKKDGKCAQVRGVDSKKPACRKMKPTPRRFFAFPMAQVNAKSTHNEEHRDSARFIGQRVEDEKRNACVKTSKQAIPMRVVKFELQEREETYYVVHLGQHRIGFLQSITESTEQDGLPIVNAFKHFEKP